MTNPNFENIAPGLSVDADYVDAFKKAGLNSIDAIFDFSGDENLAKSNMADYRSRLRFDIETTPGQATTIYLKRYNNPPASKQISNWLSHRRKDSTAGYDSAPADQLNAAGIGAPRTIAFGSQWDTLFEKRSFMAMEKIPNAEALERKLPEYVSSPKTSDDVKAKHAFIEKLADFAAKFHATGYRHRDFYLAHIFMDDSENFHLIDLHRAFKPAIFAQRFRIKDIAQLYYSAPGTIFSNADRLRFYKRYAKHSKIGLKDKLFFKRVTFKAWSMAHHDIKHGREVPFAN